jgi:protein phosphatase
LNTTCPYCGAAVQARSRFCPSCGRQLPNPSASTQPNLALEAILPVEAALPSGKQIHITGDALDLRELINVVESGVRWWQARLASADTLTRQNAAQAIDELSQILRSLSQQLALGRDTMRVTTRLPSLRTYQLGCPVCGRGNRAGAKFCQGCGASLGDTPPRGTKVGLPMPLRFTIAAQTDQGRVRKNNQDSIYTGELRLPNGSLAYLCLVADGMGGALAGEHASRIAAEVTRGQVKNDIDDPMVRDDGAWQALLRNAATAANNRVYAESRASEDRKGMGTTLTVALIVGERVHIASVGDSRAYMINAAGVTTDGATAAQLTSDHSLVARLVDIGQITPEQARTHPQRNLLYRSIGTDPSVEIDTRSEQLGAGDIILLCSDGLFTYIRDEELARIVLEQPNLHLACDRLIRIANERGGADNISVVIVRVEGS